MTATMTATVTAPVTVAQERAAARLPRARLMLGAAPGPLKQTRRGGTASPRPSSQNADPTSGARGDQRGH